jgi:pimeloyl-ACP methyl ester carboxylesterase
MLPVVRALSLLAALSAPVPTQFVQVSPGWHEAPEAARSPGQDRAVVLVHGLYVHPFSKANVARAQLHSWQRPGSLMVKRLAAEADVYAFAYAQTAAADAIAGRSNLPDCVRLLRSMGYREVVLLGHSAGGLIARALVEDCPDAGVTKVIQVCAPNGGSGWAMLQAVRANQVEFLNSLTKGARQRAVTERGDRAIPPGVEFVCVVGTGTLLAGDGLVLCRCQWSEDLQRQGVPAVTLPATHWTAVRAAKGVELAARLVREPQPRWDASQIQAARKRVLGQ